MRKEEFRKWLTSVDGRNGAQTSDHISRIKRIESAISVLDQKDCDVEDECNKDGGVTLLDRLPLSSRRSMPESVNLPLMSMGIARMRSSLRKYIDFLEWTKQSKTI